MLGLVSHEPHFTLLREVVNFNSFQRNNNATKMVTKYTKEGGFQLLHLSVLREYLDIEFGGQKTASPPYNLECVIDVSSGWGGGGGASAAERHQGWFRGVAVQEATLRFPAPPA